MDINPITSLLVWQTKQVLWHTLYNNREEKCEIMGLISIFRKNKMKRAPLAKNQAVSENSYLFYQKSKEYQLSGISQPKKLFCFKTTQYFFNLLHQNW